MTYLFAWGALQFVAHSLLHMLVGSSLSRSARPTLAPACAGGPPSPSYMGSSPSRPMTPVEAYPSHYVGGNPGQPPGGASSAMPSLAMEGAQPHFASSPEDSGGDHKEVLTMRLRPRILMPDLYRREDLSCGFLGLALCWAS